MHVAAAEAEGVTGRDRGEGEGCGLEKRRTEGAAHQAGDKRRRTGDESPAPRAEHDHGGEVDTRRDAERSGAERLPDA